MDSLIHLLNNPGPYLLFDFSRLLEYAKIRTVLQSTLGAFRTENQYDGEWSPLFRDQMESTKARHRFVFFRDAILNFQYHPRFFFISSRVVEVLTGL